MLEASEIKSFTCINCPLGCILEVSIDSVGQVESVSGHECRLGDDYGRTEAVSPRRMVCAVLNVDGTYEPVSVKTSVPIKKDMILEFLAEIKTFKLAAPIKVGDVLAVDVLLSGADLIATKSIS